jgi:hypothetical protein
MTGILGISMLGMATFLLFRRWGRSEAGAYVALFSFMLGTKNMPDGGPARWDSQGIFLSVHDDNASFDREALFLIVCKFRYGNISSYSGASQIVLLNWHVIGLNGGVDVEGNIRVRR